MQYWDRETEPILVPHGLIPVLFFWNKDIKWSATLMEGNREAYWWPFSRAQEAQAAQNHELLRKVGLRGCHL